MANIKFLLNGCDISFWAEAPEDITLKQLLKQTDKIFPSYCACGIMSEKEAWKRYGGTDCEYEDVVGNTEIYIDYNSIRKTDDCLSCEIAN